jgi:hypothetical protein
MRHQVEGVGLTPTVTDAPPARPSRSLLTSLAIINVNWDAGRQSYLDNFVPFALESMRRNAASDYSCHEVKENLVSVFGLDLPDHVVESILNRTTRNGALIRENRRYRFNPDGVDAVPNGIARTQAEVGRQHAAVIKELVEFAAERFDIRWSEDAAEEALLNHVERQAVPLLASAVEGRALAPHTGDKGGSDYIVSNYIVELHQQASSTFGHIEALVKGCMLSAALYVGSPGEVARRFRNTTLYLDTPVCLKALGLEGDEAKEATLETLRLATGQGARRACFEHTLREVEGVLEGAKTALRRGPGSETFTRGVSEHLYRIGATPNDVTLIIETLERDLAQLRIDVIEKPPHVASLTVDEQALEELMQERVFYSRDRAREYDVDSLTAVHRLRNGTSSSHLESCRAVLVTDNYPLVGAARTFFRQEHDWPVAMPEHELAALVWVKEPLSAPDLPRRQIIADCYAALAPTQSHWERIVSEIDRLEQRGDIDPADVTLLKHSNEAQKSLMDATLGDSARIGEGAIKAALERTREEVRKPATSQRDEALTRAAQSEQAETEERFERLRAESEASELREQVDALLTERRTRDDNIASRAAKVAKRTVVASIGLVAVPCVVVAALNFTMPTWRMHVPQGVGIVATVLGAVIVIIGALKVFTKGSLPDWTARPEQRLAARLERRYRRRAGLPETRDARAPEAR